jgi:YggT family protein
MIGIFVLRVVNVFLLGYLLLLSLRIVLTWFRASLYGRPWQLLERATEPYLALFRRVSLLRQGLFDFSPVVAILLIVVALDLVNELLLYGQLTLGFVLASLVSALWSGVSFLLLLFAVVGVVRLAGFWARIARNPGLWRALDMIVQPMVSWVSRLLSLGSRVSYLQRLVILAVLLFAAWFLGGIGVRVLIRALRALPV